jgi:site-specific DNA-methyltransferase (adenine-specific)
MIELLHIDCMEYMATCKDKQFDLAICDVPYGINVAKMPYLTEMSTTVKQKNGNRLNGNKNKRPYAIKEWDSSVPTQAYFDELRRISKEQIIWGIEYMNWEGVGSGRIKWDKGVADGMSFNRYEIAYCSLVNNIIELPLLWAGMCQAKCLAEPMTQQGNKSLNERRIHPTHKPILLYKRLLLDYAKPTDKIIDTHLGSGSSAIACYDFGCDFVGCEIDEDYYRDARKRFENHKLQGKLF